MSDDTYNGWTNRETWALKLWLDNDQNLYAMAHERVGVALMVLRDDDSAAYPSWCDTVEERAKWDALRAGEAIKDLWEELTDPDEGLMGAEQALSMVKDVGSDYRVNWDEIGAAYVEEVDES